VPNIDQLAREGMFFSRYYVTAPTCAPSRTAPFTGMYATELNAQNHHSEPDFPDYVKHLHAGADYYTANVMETPDKYPFSSPTASVTTAGRANATPSSMTVTTTPS
jgi:hypothetical protein